MLVALGLPPPVAQRTGPNGLSQKAAPAAFSRFNFFECTIRFPRCDSQTLSDVQAFLVRVTATEQLWLFGRQKVCQDAHALDSLAKIGWAVRNLARNSMGI